MCVLIKSELIKLAVGGDWHYGIVAVARNSLSDQDKTQRNIYFPGIFNWHSKHNTKYSVLQNTSMGYQMEHKRKSAKTHHLVDLTKEKKSYFAKQIK